MKKPEITPAAPLSPARKLLELIKLARYHEDAVAIVKLEADARNPLAITIVKLVKLATTLVGTPPSFLRDEESLVLEEGEDFVRRVYTACADELEPLLNRKALNQWIRLNEIRWELVDVGLAPPVEGRVLNGKMSREGWDEWRESRRGSPSYEATLFAIAQQELKSPPFKAEKPKAPRKPRSAKTVQPPEEVATTA